MEKLQSLAFDACKHTVTTRDAQPVMTGQTMSIIVFVSGTIALPNEERPLKFSQVRSLRQHARCARALAQMRVDARSDVCG